MKMVQVDINIDLCKKYQFISPLDTVLVLNIMTLSKGVSPDILLSKSFKMTKSERDTFQPKRL